MSETETNAAAPAEDGAVETEAGAREYDPVTKENLAPLLQQACDRAAWPALMPVQAKSIPGLLAGEDLMVQSRTGSGKTGAFLLPMLERLTPEGEACRALILTPTRELAKQVTDAAETLFAETKLRTIAVYGGVAYGPQIEAFKQGAEVVVGTPGRVLDHLMKGTLRLKDLEMLVFDEADRMLSMGFYPDMQEIRSYLPKRRVQGAMFSATFPPQILRLARSFLRDPLFLSLSRDHVHVAEVEHVLTAVPAMEKDLALTRIVEIENPASAIVFCNTKADVQYVNTILQRCGYDADCLSSDLNQKQRERVLDRVRSGSLRFLVATDVAARGIDIPEISHIIQYQAPEDPEDYIHRAGRTGRAGAGGEAITLVDPMEKQKIVRIGKQYKIDFQERPVPTEEEVQAVVAERVTALLEAKLRAKGQMETDRLKRFLPLARELGENDDEAALVAMLLDAYYQKTLHASPETGKPATAQDGGGKRGGARSDKDDSRVKGKRRGGRRRKRK